MDNLNRELTLGSLFDGSGGFPLAGALNGIRPVWASEIEPFPIRVTTKRFPDMKHLGDVSTVSGGDLKPVDIITFGSPCQDMSVAGKRAGLDGGRSSLFYEAVRIVKEMRGATNGEYPKYIIWENVPGAFSSNKGEDFRCVLKEICRIKDPEADVPFDGKWERAGEIVGDGYSVAWRQFDAQYWGVPQRRKRIYLVGDLTGQRAGKILFESESMPWNPKESFGAWKGTSSFIKGGSGDAGAICLNDQGGERMDVTIDRTNTLRAESHHPPLVMGNAVPIENHPADSRIKIKEDGISETLTSRMGTGGNNTPLVMEKNSRASGFCTEHSAKSRGIGYEEEKSPTLRAGVIPAVSIQGSMIGRELKNGPQGSGVNEDVSFTLNTADRHGVAYCSTVGNYLQSECEKSPTLLARDYKDPNIVNCGYSVRRLTPLECGRLQGFPDWWCEGLGTDDPDEKDLEFWRDVFETHRKIIGKPTKPKTDKQIIKWLKNPHSDSAEYKMWGNGIALPCAEFILSGITKVEEAFA